MSSEIAISVEALGKCYQIYEKPVDRLKQFLLPRGRRFIGAKPKQYYREFWALQDISFQIEKGETVGIIGRNGSGKSTLLQIICGTLNPSEGNVQTNGRIAALLELGSGFNPEFTGRDNVYMSGAILNLSKDEIDARFDAIAAFADIGDFIEQPVKTYSSGMFVRLAFAVNVMSEPEIMVVDEALAVGDMAFQAKCMTALRRIQDNGATILFVSHDISSVKSLCSKAAYLEQGKLKNYGHASTIAEEYMRVVREEMNKQRQAESLNSITSPYKSIEVLPEGTPSSSFKTSDEFDHRVEQFRYGTGGARIRFAELVDEKDDPIVSAEFNQEVKIKIYFDVQQESDISANYYIQDDKKNLILGAALPTIGNPLLHCLPGSQYLVVYTTLLPLQEGNYSIQLQLTQPIIPDESAEFLDVVDNAIVFQVQRRTAGRIWTKVYVDNYVSIRKHEPSSS